MEIKNQQKKALTIVIGLFVLISIIIALFVSTDNRVIYYIVLALAMVNSLFRLHSGKKVNKLSFTSNQITALLYERPFVLSKQSFSTTELDWSWSKQLVGQLATAEKLIAKSIEGETKFLLSTELMLWDTEQIEEVALYLQNQGVTIGGYPPTG